MVVGGGASASALTGVAAGNSVDEVELAVGAGTALMNGSTGARVGTSGRCPKFVMPNTTAVTPTAAVATGHHGVLRRIPKTSLAAADTSRASTLRRSCA